MSNNIKPSVSFNVECDNILDFNKPNTWCVYRIRFSQNPNTRKFYVGFTGNLESRLGKHASDMRRQVGIEWKNSAAVHVEVLSVHNNEKTVRESEKHWVHHTQVWMGTKSLINKNLLCYGPLVETSA